MRGFSLTLLSMTDFLGKSAKKSARVYVEAPDPASQPLLVPQLPTKQQRRAIAAVTRQLSHDISTEQLFTDQLIDGKVADDGESDEDEQENDRNKTRLDAVPAKPELYRIESHSALSSLEQSNGQSSSSSSLVGSRPTAKPHKLAPLNGSPGKPPPILTSMEDACSKCRESVEMPPVHCAAFTGHLRCLEALLTQLLPSEAWLDKKRRTPLFYACAANKLDCVDLLLRTHSHWIKVADKQLDAPVHVCCFFGWSECLEKLLGAGADPHVRNAKGFKPSHIAKTEQCLELLLSFGDDLLQGDKLGRTPLFVACARDRSTCVEFLCAWNLRSQSWMLEQEDQRGDRPIHAAACNGSASSLEILLRYGADPVAANAKGLSPKDLAASNHHDRCAEILTKAEDEHNSSSSAWFAPANAAGEGEWVECWDKDSGQPFYYNNLTGKCQWEKPDAPFTPHQHSQQNPQDQQEENEEEDDGAEYVWVKKKKQAVAVVTGKDTEWIAVQDPASRAIYYKNTRTGQTQWEEPDAIRQLQSAVGAKASQEASRIWEELDQSRSALAAALVKEKRRQLVKHKQTLEACRLQIKQRKEDILKREEQARLAQLLPRSSFIRRKKQSMMMKVSTHNSKVRTDLGNEQQQIEEAPGYEDRIDDICSREPALDIFLSTYLKLQGIRNLQVLTPEKRLANCLFHYYVAFIDPVQMKGMSKSQFRSVLRDALIIPSSSSTNASSASYLSLTSAGLTGNPPLKMHVIDLIFSQAERAMALEATSSSSSSPSSPSGHSSLLHHRQAAATALTPGGEAHLNVGGFITAIQIVRERVVTQVEQQENDLEIEDDEEWFVLTFLVPLALKVGARLLTQIRQCKELELQVSASSRAQEILSSNRLAIQALHRHYSSLEPALKMLTFRGLARFVLDFGVLPTNTLPSLHFLLEAVHWTSGNAHTEIVSFEKFQQVITALASLPIGESSAGPRTNAATLTEEKLVEDLTGLLRRLAGSSAVHLVGAQMLPSSGSSSHVEAPSLSSGRSVRGGLGALFVLPAAEDS